MTTDLIAPQQTISYEGDCMVIEDGDGNTYDVMFYNEDTGQSIDLSKIGCQLSLRVPESEVSISKRFPYSGHLRKKVITDVSKFCDILKSKTGIFS